MACRCFIAHFLWKVWPLLLLLQAKADPKLQKTVVQVFWMEISPYPAAALLNYQGFPEDNYNKSKKNKSIAVNLCCLWPAELNWKKKQPSSLNSLPAHNQLHWEELVKRLSALLTSSSWCELKNDVEQDSWIGAKVVVRSCKRIHISHITSKLLTGQGFVNVREEVFLLHLPFFYFYFIII